MQITEITNWLELLGVMTKRELKVRYKRTELGFLWIVITPVFQMVVIGAIFQYLLASSIQNYFLYLLSGLLAWNYFSQTVLKNTPAIVNERHMINKSYFPREIVVYSIAIAHFAHFVAGLALLLVVSIVVGVQINLFFLFVGTILLFMLTVGTSLFFAAINVRFRDTTFIVSMFFQLLFYFSPVIYSVTQLPSRLQMLVRFNPFVSILQLFQSSLAGSRYETSPITIVYTIVFSLLSVAIGLYVFQKKSRTFDDWL